MKKVLAIAVACLFLMAPNGDLSKTGKEVKSIRFSCSTTASRVVDIDNVVPYSAIHISNVSNTPVFLGAVDVDAVATAGGKGYPICMDGGVCSMSSISLAANQVYCRVASGTVVIDVLMVRD